jgi:hypothetical protein
MADRRQHPRHAAEGTVVLRLKDGPEEEISGSLVDISLSGFRCRHHCAHLSSGMEVEFRHKKAKGLARVVWNRSVGGAWETGFFVLA